MATKWYNTNTNDLVVIPGYLGIVDKARGVSIMQQRENMRATGWIEVPMNFRAPDVRKHPSYDHAVEAKTRAIFETQGLPEGEMVILHSPINKKPWRYTIHRTHADGPPTVTTMEKYGEEVTVPGVAPEPEIFTKDEQPPGYAVPCPRMVAVPMEKGTKCYLCARPLDYYFERSPGDFSKVCSHCVWSHLRYEAVPDGQGQLRRIPDEERLR